MNSLTELSRTVARVTRVSAIASTVRAMATVAEITRPIAEWAETIRPVTEVGKNLRATTEAIRAFGEKRAAAEETAKALAALPTWRRKRLTVITRRCPKGKQLLQVVRIPDHLPGARYDRHLVIPTSATTYKYGDQRITARAWFLVDHDETSGVRCRCHPEVTFTREQLSESRHRQGSAY